MVDSSDITKLPNELLAKIFVTYKNLDNSNPGWSWKPDASPPWLQVMLVCRQWRAIALATTPLWTTISLGLRRTDFDEDDSINDSERVQGASRWLDLVIPRTASATLKIVFKRKAVAVAILPGLIRTQAHRISRISVPQEDAPGKLSDLANIIEDVSFPALEELYMSLAQYSTAHIAVPAEAVWPASHRVGAAIIPSHFPALRRLLLAQTILNGTSTPLFQQLTLLELEYCAFAPDSHQHLHNFLGAIELCQNVTHLHLSMVMSMRGNQPPADISPKVIRLPKLVALTLRDTPAYTSWFLSSIALTLDVNLFVSGMVEGPVGPNDVPALFAALLPADLSTIPHLRASTCGYVCEADVMDNMLLIHGTNIHLYLEFLCAQPLMSLHSCLIAFGALFAGASITRLQVHGQLGGGVRDTPSWVDFLAGFPLIEDLEIGWCGSLLGLVCALGRSPLPTSDGKPEDAYKGVIVCPKLESIKLDGQSWQAAGFVESLVSVLRRRSARGLQGWKRLNVIVHEAIGEELKEAADFYEEELALFVDEFCYECIRWDD